ncbi:MAG TPA: methyl-accepting chemotaxis protein [Chloroflexota bacterium]|jgi:methyl-accepting chemotaxis protein
MLARVSRVSIGTRVLIAGALCLLGLSAVTLFVVKVQLEQAMLTQYKAMIMARGNFHRYLVDEKGVASISNGKLTFGSYVANDDFSIVDTVKDKTGSEATLFQLIDGKLIRVTTTVPKADGSGRGVGTELIGPAAEAFKRGESYLGINPILGKDYIARYDLIRDAANKPIGYVLTATQVAAMYDAIQQTMTAVVGAAVGGTTVSLLALFLVLRPVRRSLGQMLLAARGLAEGDLEQRIDTRAQDEVGQVAAAFRDMVAYQRTMAEVAQAVARGDLSRTVKAKSERDVLGTAFGAMIADLRTLVGRIQSAAQDLASTSSELGSAAAETGSSVQQVARAIESVAAGAADTSRGTHETTAAVSQLGQAIDGIARGASEQAGQVQSASTTAMQMAEGVTQVASSAQNVARATQETQSAARDGRRAVDETISGMAQIEAVVGEAAGRVHELGKLGERIGQVVETIDDIAEQTNLLALNAAIEAARAGEHGKGFAVVADEVRKLAERSGRETKQIAELIQQVQHGTRDAVQAMEEGARQVSQGTARANQAGEALVAILTAVDATVGQVDEIALAANSLTAASVRVSEAMQAISAVVEENTAATEEMAAQSQQVSGAISAIASVSTQQSAATQEVGASAGEMTLRIESISAQAEQLARTAGQLRELAGGFRLEVDADVVESEAARWLPRAA